MNRDEKLKEAPLKTQLMQRHRNLALSQFQVWASEQAAVF